MTNEQNTQTGQVESYLFTETPEHNSRANIVGHARPNRTNHSMRQLVTPQSYQIVHERHITKPKVNLSR